MREQKEWIVQGFKDEAKEKIESKLMDDEYSYWFRYRSIPWYRKRRLKGNSPKETIEKALNGLQIEASVWKKDQWKQISSYWVIEPK
jgi:hypothetical protein